MQTILPNYEDVIEIHFELAEIFKYDEDPISPPDPRDENLIHSACLRPHTGIGDRYKYTDEYYKIAALFHSLITNHPFHNGNKRTALAAMIASLYWQKRIFDYEISDNSLY